MFLECEHRCFDEILTTVYWPMQRRFVTFSSDILCCSSACDIKLILCAIKFVYMQSQAKSVRLERGEVRGDVT